MVTESPTGVTVPSVPVDDAVGPEAVVVRAGPPARALAAAAPLIALGLVLWSASRGGLDRTAADVVPPWVLAVVTLVAAGVVSWRAATQRAELTADGVRCRNLLVSFEADWELVERLRVDRRGPLVTVDLVFANLRRTHRVGAATRFGGVSSGGVLEALGRIPAAAHRLDDAAP